MAVCTGDGNNLQRCIFRKQLRVCGTVCKQYFCYARNLSGSGGGGSSVFTGNQNVHIAADCSGSGDDIERSGL